jgi:hypothetical protein
MEISVAVATRPDVPLEEELRTAAVADRLGYSELWIAEGLVWDSFALATAIGVATERAESSQAARAFLRHGEAQVDGDVVSAHYRLRLDPPGGPLTVAAFGDRAIAVAAAQPRSLDRVAPVLPGCRMHRSPIYSGGREQ